MKKKFRKKTTHTHTEFRTRTPHYNLKSQICDIFSLICRIYFVRSFFPSVWMCVLHFRASETLLAAHIRRNTYTKLIPSARKSMLLPYIHTHTHTFHRTITTSYNNNNKHPTKQKCRKLFPFISCVIFAI